jgi:putative hydrolase of the HAD superfamily
LGIPASEAMMVGDGFEKDILAANEVGIFAVWFNPRSDENRESDLHITVHSMGELLAFFRAMN